MNKTYAIIGAGNIGNISAQLTSQIPDIIIVNDIKDIPKEAVYPIKNFDRPIIEISERYTFDEFSRKKKPKNDNWQMRMKQLQRKK